MGYEVGDLVWAKMKSYPPWPAKIAEPNSKIQPPKKKKVYNFVCFFGSKDFAWIPEENITPHSENIFNSLIKKKTKAYQQAIDELMASSGSVEKQKQTSSKIKENVEKTKKKVNEKVEKSKKIEKVEKGEKTENIEDGKKSTRIVKVIQSVPKKCTRKVLAHKSPIKKVSKKRCFDDDNGETSANSPMKSRKLDTVDNTSVNSLHSIERGESSENSVVSSRHSVEKNQSLENLPDNSRDSFESNAVLDNSNEFIESDEAGITELVTQLNKKFGFIGLIDEFGRAILKKFIECGMEVTLWAETSDQSAEFTEMKKGIKVVDSPAELIVDCDITFCCYDTDTDVFKNIIFGEKGILKGFEEAEKLKQKHKGYVLLKRIDYETSVEINEAISIKNGLYLEAPVVGAVQNVQESKLMVVASGSRKLFAACQKCFQIIASKCEFLDCNIGVSSKMSVILNTVTGTVYGAMAEAMGLADRFSLFRDVITQVMRHMLDSDSFIDKAERMSRHLRSSKRSIPLKKVQNDIDLSLRVANSVSQSMPITSAANEVFKYARLLNYSNSDVTAVYNLYRTFL